MNSRAFYAILVRAIGLMLIVLGLPGVFAAVVNIYREFYSPNRGVFSFSDWLVYSNVIEPALRLIIGAYLYFGAGWLIRRSTRKLDGHCERCGYPVATVQGENCPECNWPILPRPVLIRDDEPEPPAEAANEEPLPPAI